MIRKKLIMIGMLIGIMGTALGFSVETKAQGNVIELQPNQDSDVTLTEPEERTDTEGVIQEYSFTMPANSYVSFDVTMTNHVYDHDYTGLNSDSLRVKVVSNYKEYEDESYSPKDGTVSTNYYQFKKGTKITVTVSMINGYCGPVGTYSYRVRPVVVKPKNFDVEPNDTKAKANTIKLNKTMSGLVTAGDVDYWVFKAPKTGKYKVKAVVTRAKRERQSTKVSTYKNGKQLYYLYLKTGDGWKDVSNGYVTLKKGKTLIIKLDGENYQEGSFYKLKVSKK